MDGRIHYRDRMFHVEKCRLEASTTGFQRTPRTGRLVPGQ